MKKTIAVLCLTVPFALTDAHAITIGGSATGTWENAQMDADDVVSYENLDNNVDATTSNFNWGLEFFLVSGSQDNLLSFDGANNFSVNAGEVFSLGELEYFNGRTFSSTDDGVTSVDLRVNLQLNAPLIVSGDSLYEFGINITPNTGGSGSEDVNDEITFAQTKESFSFIYDEMIYSLSILGFSDDFVDSYSPYTYGDMFSSPEEALTGATLLARFDADPVPEPGTFMLFGVGILGVAGYLRRKK